MYSKLLSLILLFATAAHPAHAQVEVTRATEDAASESKILAEDIPSPCPMQIDISLGSSPQRRAFAEIPPGESWLSTEMRHYVCHTERIAMVLVRNVKNKKGSVELLVQPTVMSEQWRQDVDLTISLVGSDGREHCRIRENNLTVGKDRGISDVTWVTFASSTKRPEFKCKLTRMQYESLFGDASQPTLRIILAPQLDEDEG